MGSLNKQSANQRRAAATRPLVRIIATLAVSACASAPEPEQVPPPPPPRPVLVDTAVPPQLRASRELVLLGTTDVHNRLYPYDYYTRQEIGYSLAHLKPLIDSVRTANAGRTYLFDSGDLLQGNPLGFVYARTHADKPNPVIRAMNLLGYNASTIGNHEYNYGLQHLNRAMEQASFPFVTGNVFKHGTQEHAYQPYTLIPHAVAPDDTILIGITGNTPPGVHIWDKANVEGVLQFRDVVSSLRPVVQEMKARGADVVVVLSHGGLAGTSYDTATTGLPSENASAALARAVPQIDVIFLGHTHRELADSTINSVLLTQARNWAQNLAVATLTVERRGRNDWHVVQKKGQILRPNPLRADSAFLDSLRWEHERTVAYVNSVAGRSTERLEARSARVQDTPIIDFINEVMRRRAGADLAATAAFNLNAVIPQGPVTIADVAGLYIYDNTLKAVRITGAQLRAYLEKSSEYYNSWPIASGGTVTNFEVPGYNFDIVSGVDYAIDLTRPVGQRITELTYQRRPVSAEQTFTLALNNYRQTGGGGYAMLAAAPVVYDRQEDIRELLIEELRTRGTLRPRDYFRENWRIVPEAARNAARTEQSAREVARTDTRDRNGVKRLRVLSTNDFHGRLLPEKPSWANGREVGGAAALKAYFDAEKAAFAGPTAILDGGDIMQGTTVSNLTKGRATVDFFNRAGYGAAAIGNHEFDWTLPVLRERIRQARYAWLGANIFVAGTDTQPSWTRATTMLNVDGIRVGVIGLTTEETPTVTRASNVAGLEFRAGGPVINRWVPELRRAGADFVIVVAHAGAICERQFQHCEGEMVDWARSVRNKPDLIVAGHTHQVVRWVENDIPIVEAGSYSTRYAVVDLTRDSAGTRAWIRGIPVTFTDRVRPDTTIQRIVAAQVREIGPEVNRVVVTFGETVPRTSGESPLGNLIADAFRVTTGAQISFVNNGSIRIAEIPAGPVTWGTLYALQPFENRMMVLTMTGEQIRSVLEHAVAGRQPDMHLSGITVLYDPAQPIGGRVQRITLAAGTEVRPAESYRVAVTDFLASGSGDDYAAFGRASRREDAGLLDLEALIRYVQSLPQPVRVDESDRRFRVTQSH